MSESTILHAVRAVLAEAGPTWRNNTGVDVTRGVRYGIGVGGADLISVVPVLITPEMVGKTLGRFVGTEVKTPEGRMRPEQRMWRAAVEKAGGLYILARSPEDALRGLES